MRISGADKWVSLSRPAVMLSSEDVEKSNHWQPSTQSVQLLKQAILSGQAIVDRVQRESLAKA